ncbi:enterobactin exporter EntS [Streptomyces sp. YIM 121038]|uniref:MFS transporter n=1 Tax=Streptomyces sp. YIM 121038 TaxID=2136401 RepID=UPI001110B87F|nr:MFS transporter [Streptomyces sp. YIM 121038]QCX80851.1 enterobactin exporter EntS [Streptomyces sp. YIM 121038]
MGSRERFAVFRDRDFSVFFVGYVTSNLGTSMASVALAFAVLHNDGSPTDLSLVLAARIVPMVLLLLGGGVLGDRLPRRLVMLVADSVRALSQGALAVLLLIGPVPLWVVLTLAACGGVGEALFRPSFDGLVPQLAPKDRLPEANSLLGMAQSAASVGGPALAGVLVAVTSAATVLLVDALSYVVSVGALLMLRAGNRAPDSGGSSMVAELRAGWRAFSAHTWLWTVTLQFTLFNLLVWAPYLVLGPVSAGRSYGGSEAWGLIVGTFGGGSLLGGLLLLGRRPSRPLVVTTLITFLWAAPSAALAVRAPLWTVCAAALAAGVSSAVFNSLWMTTIQQHVPADSLSRVMSYVTFGAYSVGPVGLALAGPLAEQTSIGLILAIGVGWQILANSVVLMLPAVRNLHAPNADRNESAAENSAESAESSTSDVPAT